MTANPIEQFRDECRARVGSYPDSPVAQAAHAFLEASIDAKYSYNFTWVGLPIVQYPQDIVAMQEIIWRVRPTVIIETGIARGGSLAFSASMLALLDYSDAVQVAGPWNPSASKRKVIGVDIDLRPHNRSAIETHPFAHKIELVIGSSIDPSVVADVHKRAAGADRVLVCLDSNHTHDHVLAELEAYAPLTSVDSYCVVFDTVIEDLAKADFSDRPWAVGNNPKTAVREYQRRLAAKPATGVDGRRLVFQVDRDVDNKVLVSVAPEGYLKRVGAK